MTEVTITEHAVTDPGYFTHETQNAFSTIITGYTGNDYTVIIPDEIDGYAVVGIGYAAFYNKDIISVVLPENLKTIGSSAFSSCSQLGNVYFNNKLEQIDYSAFSYCSSLKNISIPSSVTEIGAYAFYNCTGIKHIQLPDTVTSIGERAFSGCTQLDMINYPLDLEYTGSGIIEDCPLIERITVPYGVTILPRSVFADASSLREVDLPETLEEIGAFAFYDCKNITSIEIPDSVTKIGSEAFAGCDELAMVSVPASWIEVTEDVYYQSPRSPFFECESLNTVILPDGMTRIPDYAFYGVTNLKEVSIPLSVTEIGVCAFEDCTSLINITLPDGITKIGNSAFYGCTYLCDFEFPPSLTELGNYSFGYCESLQNILLPDTVTDIGNHAFAGCINVCTFYYPINWTNVIGDTYFGYPVGFRGGIFEGCTNLKHIDVPEGVEKIPGQAFEDCDCLETISLPSSLKSIGRWTFAGCTSLTDLELPDDLVDIEDYCFTNCESLGWTYIGSNVTSIGMYVFDGCSGLTIESEYGSEAIRYAKENGISYYYLSLTGASKPTGRLYKEEVFTLKGYVRSSIEIDSIVATIYNSDKSEIIQQVIVDDSGKTDYSLNGYINGSLHFETLPLGTYYYSISAATELTEEIFVECAFQIVPPPLRIIVEDDRLPSGLQTAGLVLQFGGIIHSNYNIDSVTVQIIDLKNNSTVMRQTEAPNRKSYDISSLTTRMNSSSLTYGEYACAVNVLSNNENRQVAYSQFIICSYDGNISEDDYLAVTDFVLNNDSQQFWRFISEYAVPEICDISRHSVSKGLVITWSKYHEVFSSKVKDVFMGTTYSSYWVKVYKQYILDLLKDTSRQTSVSDQILEDEEFIRDSLLKYGKIEISYIKNNGIDLSDSVVEYLETYNTCLDMIGKEIDCLEFAEDVVDIFTEQIVNYERDMRIIDGLKDACSDPRENPEYIQALEELKAEYQSRSVKALLAIYNKVLDELIKSGSKMVTKTILEAAGAGASCLYSIVTFCIDVSAELFGVNDTADSILEFEVVYECALNASAAYSDAHSAVLKSIVNDDGPTSEQVNRFLSSFELAKTCTLRLINVMINNSADYNERNIFIQERNRIQDLSVLQE